MQVAEAAFSGKNIPNPTTLSGISIVSIIINSGFMVGVGDFPSFARFAGTTENGKDYVSEHCR